jgi:peptidoglycan/LPS O-acetylase OafA/YrhL
MNSSEVTESALGARSRAEQKNASRDPRSRGSYRPDIDGLRALAIIPVVLFHAFPALMPGGFVGVDIFFVISGYLISSIIIQARLRGSFSFAGFYANRITRLFPALLVVLAACFAFGWFFLLPDEYQRLGKHIVGAASYVENFVLRREAGYFDVSSHLKPLMHLWSLGIEEQFYLTYPLFLWIVWRFRRSLFAVLLSLAAFSFCLNVWQVGHDTAGAFFLPQTRGWELLAGGAIACWQLLRHMLHTGSARLPTAYSPSQDQRFPAIANACSATGFLLIAVALFRIHESARFPGWWALLPVGGASLLIAGGPAAWINRKVLANQPMVLIGLISYPLYLWHWPILSFPRILRGTELPVSVRVFGVLLSCVLAWVTWRFIESPIRFGRKTWIKPVALTATSVVVAGVGYATFQDGFARRFPEFRNDIGDLRHVQWSTAECRKLVGVAEMNYCRTTAVRQPDVLIIGDSHASVLYDGLAPIYLKHSQILMNLGEAGCVPFYDTDSFSPGARHKDCRPAVNRMLDFAISSTTARTVLLSFRGPRYMSGDGFGDAEAHAGSKKIIWDAAQKDAPQSQIFGGALRNTIQRLVASGKNVVFILDWPELGFEPGACLPRPISLFSNPPGDCAVPRVQVDSRNRSYRELVFQLRKEFTSLRIFDPFPYLCDTSECRGMRAGHLLYSDNNHLSLIGAAYLSEKYFEEQSSAGTGQNQ